MQAFLQEATALKLMGLISEAVTVAGSYSVTNNPLLAEHYDQVVLKIREKFSDLDTLVKNDPVQVANLDQVKKNANNLISLFDDYRNKVKEKQTLKSLISHPEYILALKTASKNLGMASKKFIDAEKQIEELSPVLQEKNRQLISLAFLAGIVLNVVIAIGLSLFFSKGVTKRLSVLTDNADKIAKHQTLNKPLIGGDEIADLDQAFHSMANKLDQADRLKNQLIDMVSHDLKSPLTSVQGILTLLAAGSHGELPSKVVQKLDMAQEDVVRLISLINDLLDVEKMKAGKLQLNIAPIRLSKIINSSVNAVSGLIQAKQIEVTTQFQDKEIKADEERLIQVIVNLLSNAIKFSPAKSTIAIEAKDLASTTEISIIDQGRGIPQEQMQRIFDRFTQIESSDAFILGGSGLGLNICKAIVESHGGNIGVTSKPNEGSVFFFTIPNS